ncbi:MAG: hypothetical protein V1774_05450 [Candidatus Eisenbacteria bacterium]
MTVSGRLQRRLVMGVVCVCAVVGPGFHGFREASAAHEWRAEWASLYSLGLIDEQAMAREERPRWLLALARPFGLPGIGFQRIVWRAPWGGWEAHCGSVSGPGYREWHLGCGRNLGLTGGLELLAGARMFVVEVENMPAAICGAATIIGRLRPWGMSAVAMEAGLVDVAFSADPCAPAPIFTARIRARAGGGYRLVVERSVSPEAAAETTLAILLRRDWLSLGQSLRCSTGEAGLSLGCRSRALEVVLAERWHPQLGWTSEVSLRWHPQKGGSHAQGEVG